MSNRWLARRYSGAATLIRNFGWIYPLFFGLLSFEQLSRPQATCEVHIDGGELSCRSVYAKTDTG
jgi:hypothetical protein